MSAIVEDDASPRARATEPTSLLNLLKGREDDLRNALAVIRKRRAIIASTALLVTLATAIVVFQLTPRYTATATLTLNTRSPNVVSIAAVVAGLPLDPNIVKSEVDIIESRSLAMSVIKQLHLADDPEFAPQKGSTGLLGALNPRAWLPPEWRTVILGSEIEPTPEHKAAVEEARITDVFLSRLKVSNVPLSYTINVEFESEDPEKARRIANAIAERYISDQLQNKLTITRRANAWLTDRLTELREKLRRSEQAVQDFRAQSNLIETTGQTLANQQLSDLNAQLSLTRVERAKSESELAQLRSLDAANMVDQAPEVLASPTIASLREKEAELLRAQAQAQGGRGNEQQGTMAAQIESIRGSIAKELRRIIGSRESDLAAIVKREATLSGYVDKLRDEVIAQSRSQVRLAELEREADTDRTLLDTFLIRSKETAGQNDFEDSDARIISPADLPLQPSFPHRLRTIIAAFFVSSLLGIGLAFLVDRLHNGFRFPEEIERLTGVSVLRVVPALPRSLKPQDFVLRQPTSPFAEALQAIRTGLNSAGNGRPPRSVLITSGTAREGKSTLSLSLARMIARSGQKVMLIDADMRRAKIAELLGLKPEYGLDDVLTGKAQLTDAVVVDPASGLEIIPSLSGTSQPQDLLASAEMKGLMNAVTALHDLVIVDSPPVTFVSDAVILSKLVDGTIYVVRWETTPGEVVLSGVQHLRRSGAQIFGAVLNQARLRKHEAYGYGTNTSYYGTTASRESA